MCKTNNEEIWPDKTGFAPEIHVSWLYCGDIKIRNTFVYEYTPPVHESDNDELLALLFEYYKSFNNDQYLVSWIFWELFSAINNGNKENLTIVYEFELFLEMQFGEAYLNPLLFKVENTDFKLFWRPCSISVATKI